MPAPHGGDVGLARLQLGQRRFELALADVAPGADDVRHDIDDEIRSRRLDGGVGNALAHGRQSEV